jgi:hypothetical protein
MPAGLASSGVSSRKVASLAPGFTCAVYTRHRAGRRGWWMGAQKFGWRPHSPSGLPELSTRRARICSARAPGTRPFRSADENRRQTDRTLRELLRLRASSLSVAFGACPSHWSFTRGCPLLVRALRLSLAAAVFRCLLNPGASFIAILAGRVLADRWSQENPRGRILTQSPDARCGAVLFLRLPPHAVV